MQTSTCKATAQDTSAQAYIPPIILHGAGAASLLLFRCLAHVVVHIADENYHSILCISLTLLDCAGWLVREGAEVKEANQGAEEQVAQGPRYQEERK